MIQQFLKYGNTFCAVEHAITKDAVEQYNLLVLKRKKKELIIAAKQQFTSFDDLLVKIKTQKHVFLIINNQQVLLKKIATNSNASEKLVKTAFPSIKSSDFYYETISNNEDSFVAICRKKYIDKIIQQYKFNGQAVIDFSIDNFVIQTLVPYLNQEEIYTTNSLISFTENSVKNFSKNNFAKKEYNINNLHISNAYVLSLAGIISYFSGVSKTQIGFKKLQDELQNQYFHKRFFNLGLKTALGSIFVILLINFIFFYRTHAKRTTLEAELLVNGSYKNTLIQLQNRVAKKNKLVTSITSLSKSKTSWYINEIGKSTPKKLQLDILKFQPLKNTIKENKEVVLNRNKILVKGTSKNNKDFSNWIALLELKEWVKEIVVLSYGKGKQITATFEFIITLK